MAEEGIWLKTSKSEWVRRDDSFVETLGQTWRAVISESNGSYERAVTAEDVTGVERGGGLPHEFKTAKAAMAWLDANQPMPPTFSDRAFRGANELPPPLPDPVASFLVSKGYVPNVYILDLNRGLTTPYDTELVYPWSLPSRMFRFPVEVSRQYADGSRKCGIIHPMLKGHPFVKAVTRDLADIGITMSEEGAPDENGYSKFGCGSWWHAIDLMADGLIDDLFETMEFTAADEIARAVIVKLLCGDLDVGKARGILNRLEVPEPADRLDIFCRFPPPSESGATKQDKDGGAKRVPVNCPQGEDQGALAWAFVTAIEAGLFSQVRGSGLSWTKKGADMRSYGRREIFVEAGGQCAFAF